MLIFICPQRLFKIRNHFLKSWGRSLCFILGVKINLQGSPSNHTGILIANHRSYIDIPVLMGLNPCCFLAKAEVRQWPLIGLGASLAGCVFVNRNDPASRSQSRQVLQQRIQQGLSVLVFAEGTTTAQGELLPLKPGMFHEAKKAELPIHLICIEYSEANDAWTEQSTMSHFMDRFSRWRTHVYIVYKTDPLETSSRSVDQLREQSKTWLRSSMQNIIKETSKK